MADPISAIDAAITIVQAELGFENAVNTNDPVTQLNELGQMASGISSSSPRTLNTS